MLETEFSAASAASEETRAFYEKARAVYAKYSLRPTKNVDDYRATFARLLDANSPGGKLYRSPNTRSITVPTASGGVPLRVFPSPNLTGVPTGVHLFVHGGGWIGGTADSQDTKLERAAQATGMTIASVEYRLAPEAPFPGPLDDCEAAARWLIANAGKEFGSERLVISGDSAGANLALATLLRLKDSGLHENFRAAHLLYGVFDLSMTPSQYKSGDSILRTENLRWYYDLYVPKDVERRHPHVSPLYADLSGLPPTLLSIGTADSLFDDTLFMYCRLLKAGVRTEIQIVPGADHGFDGTPLAVARAAQERAAGFLTHA